MSAATAVVDDPKQRLKEKLDNLLERADQKRLVLDQTKHMFAVGEMNHVLYMRTLADADHNKHLVVDAVGGLLHHHFKNIIAKPVKYVLEANMDNTSDDSTSVDPRVYFVNLYQTLLNELDTEYDADIVGGVTGATSGHWSNTISGSGSYRQRVKYFLSDALDRMAKEFVRKDLLTASFVPTRFDMSHFKAMLFVYSLTDYARKRLDTKVIDAAAMVGIYATDRSAHDHGRISKEFYDAFTGKTGRLDSWINRVVSWFTGGSYPADVVQSQEEAEIMANLKTASDALWKRFGSHYTKNLGLDRSENLKNSLRTMLTAARLAIYTPEKLRLVTPLVDAFVRNFISNNDTNVVDITLNAFQENSLSMSLRELTRYDGGSSGSGSDYFLEQKDWLTTTTNKSSSSSSDNDLPDAEVGVFDLMQNLSELRKSYFAHVYQYFFEKTLPQLKAYATQELRPVEEFGLVKDDLFNPELSGEKLRASKENYKKYVTWLVKRDLFKRFYDLCADMKKKLTKKSGPVHQNVYDVLVMHVMYDIVVDSKNQDKPIVLAEQILARLFRVVHICSRSRSILEGVDKYAIPDAFFSSSADSTEPLVHQDLIDRMLLVYPYTNVDNKLSGLKYDDPKGHTWSAFKDVMGQAAQSPMDNTFHIEDVRNVCTNTLKNDERFTSVPGYLFKALFEPIRSLLDKENRITDYVLYSMDDDISIGSLGNRHDELVEGFEEFRQQFEENNFEALGSKLGLEKSNLVNVPANPEVYLSSEYTLSEQYQINASVAAVAVADDDDGDGEAIELASVVSSHLSLVSGNDNPQYYYYQQQHQEGAGEDSSLHVQHQMMIDTISTSGVSIMSPRSSILGDEGETIELVNGDDDEDDDDEVIEIDDDVTLEEEEEAYQAPRTIGIGYGVAQQQYQYASDLNQAQQAASGASTTTTAFFKNIFGL